MKLPMRRIGKWVSVALASMAVLWTIQAPAATISDLFNTGVDGSGVKVTPANATTTDLHYTDTSAASVFVLQDPHPLWLNSADSNWISIAGSQNGTEGPYTRTYQTTFTLPGNADLSSVNIVGQVAVDNLVHDIFINGNGIGFSLPLIIIGNFDTFHQFTIPTGFFSTGTNTLSFLWENATAQVADNPGAINIRFTTKDYAVVPVPPALWLLGSSLIALAGIGRRKSQPN